MISSHSNKLNFYFVIKLCYENESVTSDEMKMAFTKIVDLKLHAKWIKESNCEEIITTEKGNIFVFEDFKGDIFNKFVTSNRNTRIIGPDCLLKCLSEDITIPNTNSPVYNMAMNGLLISISGLSLNKKKRIKELVGYMGGKCTDPLTTSTTHLIVSSVFSEKYQKASENQIPTMKPEWVEHVWTLSLKSDVKATDSDLIKTYKCPIFYNLMVTTSQLNLTEKMRIETLVNEGGGQYSPDLIKNKTKVLIIRITDGEKYKCAKLWGIKCLKPDWIEDCIKNGYAVPTEHYVINSNSNCSTPVNSHQRMVPLIDTNDSELSVIPLANEKSVVTDSMNDTSQVKINDKIEVNKLINNPAINIFKTPVKKKVEDDCSRKEKAEYTLSYRDFLNNIDISEMKKCISLLDGCKVFLSGFSFSEEEKLRRILNYGGAVRFTELNESVTHIIIGNPDDKDLQQLKRISNKPNIVTLEWLTSSIKQNCLMKENNYFYSLENKTQMFPHKQKVLLPSPLSKKGLQMLTPAEINDCNSTKINVDYNLIRQYSIPDLPGSIETENPKPETNDIVINDKHPENKEQTTNATVNEPDCKLFFGLKFAVIGHNPNTSEDIKSAIIEYGGTVISGNRTVIDYTVVPFSTVTTKIISNEIVTGFWLEECINEQRIVDVKYYHRPVIIPDFVHSSPLSNCVITFSSFSAFEKQYLENIASFMGAKCQEMLSKKQIDEKGLVQTTHLVCAVPQGVKFAAAKKWNLPIIREQWLLECFKYGLLLPVDKFLLIDPKNDGDVMEGYTTFKKAVERRDKTEIAVNTKCEILQPFSGIEKISTMASVKELPENMSNANIMRISKSNLTEISKSAHSEEKSFKNFNTACTLSTVNTINQNLISSRQNISSANATSERNKKLLSKDTNNYPPGLLLQINASSEKRCISGMKRKLNSPITTFNNKYDLTSPKKKIMCIENNSPFGKVGWQDTFIDHPLLINNTNEIQDQQNNTDNVLTQRINYNFMVSVVQNQKKEHFENIVKTLGGNLLSCYQNNCEEKDKPTHLVIDELKKTEKLLCSLASGLWILHPSYLEKSKEQSRFLPEEEYEWGNPKTGNLLTNDPKSIIIAKAAYRWRKTITEGGAEKRSFVGMNVVIISSVTDNLVESLTRLVESGGGNVLPISEILNATHCLVKSQKHLDNIPVPLKQLAERKIHCLPAVYLSDRLLHDPPPEPERCYFEVYKQLLK